MTTPKSFLGANLDDALSAACNGLGSRLEELHYEVVESGVPVFGICLGHQLLAKT